VIIDPNEKADCRTNPARAQQSPEAHLPEGFGPW